MCGYFCIGFIDFILKGILFYITNLFSLKNMILSKEYKKNDKIILKCFQLLKRLR